MYDPRNQTLKLIDFGYSVEFTDGKQQEWNFGTPLYSAPEVLLWRPHNPAGADIWSLGIVLYEMLTGKNPWQGARSINDLVELVINKAVFFPSDMSPQLVQLIERMTEINPSDRISIKALRAALIAL